MAAGTRGQASWGQAGFVPIQGPSFQESTDPPCNLTITVLSPLAWRTRGIGLDNIQGLSTYLALISQK